MPRSPHLLAASLLAAACRRPPPRPPRSTCPAPPSTSRPPTPPPTSPRRPLDQSVQSLLPGGVRVPAGARPITLKDLAVHGSGLPRLPTNLNVARVRFEADASGAWSRLRLDQNGRTTRATR